MLCQHKGIHCLHQCADAFVLQSRPEEYREKLSIQDHNPEVLFRYFFRLKIMFQNAVITDGDVFHLICGNLEHRIRLKSGKIHTLFTEIFINVTEKSVRVRAGLIHLVHKKKRRNPVMREEIPQIPHLPGDAVCSADYQYGIVKDLKNPLRVR